MLTVLFWCLYLIMSVAFALPAFCSHSSVILGVLCEAINVRLHDRCCFTRDTLNCILQYRIKSLKAYVIFMQYGLRKKSRHC